MAVEVELGEFVGPMIGPFKMSQVQVPPNKTAAPCHQR